MTPFEELLQELGKVFQLPLHVDAHDTCAIRIHEDLIIQLQLDINQENLWLFCPLTEIPPGKFRENILKEALKANNRPDPISGIYAYLEQKNQLIQFQKYPLHVLNGKRLAGIIGAFLEWAELWREAIANGRAGPTIDTNRKS